MYSYFAFLQDIERFKLLGAEVGAVGYSESGLLIPFIRVGEGEKKIIVTGAIHARESLTAKLIVRQIDYALNRRIDGRIYFVPMLNPDGVLLIEKGADYFPQKAEFLKMAGDVYGGFLLWKANINGVDLNTNFDARWGKGVKNTFTPSGENYIGAYPFSQSESRAIRDFTLKIYPDATVSYHAKGREIYWYFYQSESDKKRDFAIAKKLNERLKYTLQKDETDSAGGYKDWCVSALKIPAFTIEIISDEFSHPLSDSALTEEEVERNLHLPLTLLSEI